MTMGAPAKTLVLPSQSEVTMPDIFHDFPIRIPRTRVHQAVSTPAGLDSWWTKKSAGTPVAGAEYELWFGPQYDWRASVSRCVENQDFELQMGSRP
jgi:hypothetical protein